MGAKSDIYKEKLLDLIRANPLLSSKQIHDRLQFPVSYATLKRLLQGLVAEGMLESPGKGKASKYQVSSAYEILHPVDTGEYFKKEIDERRIKEKFNHDLLREILPRISLFTETELNKLNALQEHYRQNISKLSPAGYKKELERLAIDLSWKSSQIEGNTYSLLETELLLKEKQTAAGKTKDEAVMLLNHKAAIDFIVEHPDYVATLTVAVIEDIHSLLIKDLAVDRNIRTRRVGISGTNYTPIDNEFQIREAMEELCTLVNRQENVFAKALFALLLLSYIQPFADGNKRTARIVSNALLIHHQYCPVSFRTADAIEYKKALLLFYEQNNITAFKKIFIGQFEFAVKTYF